MLRGNRRINNLGYHVDQPVMARSYGTKMLNQNPKQVLSTCSLPESMVGHTCQTFSQNKSYQLIRYMAVRHSNPKQVLSTCSLLPQSMAGHTWQFPRNCHYKPAGKRRGPRRLRINDPTENG